MFLEIATHAAVTGAFEAYEHREDVSELWNKVLYRIKNGKLVVLVVGPGGVGKTTLSNFLGSPRLKLAPSAYEESFHAERFPLPGGVVAELITAPGQETRRDDWDAIFSASKRRGCSFGIINVVAYGFHSTTLDMKDRRRNNEGTSAATSRYFGECRVKELEVVKEVSSRLARHTKPFWMISLVTKQDLWWPDRRAVKTHYEGGEYSKLISTMAERHGATGFRHEFFSLSLHSQNFADGSGSVVQPTAAGYDDAIKYAHQQRLLEMLQGFTSATAK